MLSKRIIPCLDIKEGRVVKGVKFLGLRDAGDPVEVAKIYDDQGADELTFLDITASFENRKTLLALVEKIAQNIFINFFIIIFLVLMLLPQSPLFAHPKALT